MAPRSPPPDELGATQQHKAPSSFDVVVEETGTEPTLRRPSMVVMQERPVSDLSDLPARLGLTGHLAGTGVETMGFVASHGPAWVLIGPGDAERRRVLCGALKKRSPGTRVAVVVAAGDTPPGDVDAALPWPLPALPAICAALGLPPPPSSARQPPTRVVPPVARMSAASGPDEPPTLAVTPLLTADESESGVVDVNARTRPKTRTAPLPPEVTQTLQLGSPAAMAPIPVGARRFGNESTAPMSQVRPAHPTRGTPLGGAPLGGAPSARLGDDGDLEGPTAPSARAAPALHRSLGEERTAADLLRDAAELLWGLDTAARFLESLEAHHVGGAGDHARTVRAAASLLTDLHTRLGEP